MQVLETPLPLPTFSFLLTNLGPDDVYLGESTIEAGEGVKVAVDDAITIGASNSITYAVSDGESDIRILGQGLGMYTVS